MNEQEKDAEIEKLRQELIGVIQFNQRCRVLIGDMLGWICNVPYRGDTKESLKNRSREILK